MVSIPGTATTGEHEAMRRVGFSVEGIVAANTIAMMDFQIGVLEDGKKYPAADAIKRMRDNLVVHMPVQDYLHTSDEE